MNTKFVNSITKFVAVLPLLMAMFLSGFGCNTSKPTPDPLAGFHAASKGLDPLIVSDYEGYIQKLSPEEKQNLGPYPATFLEDGTGQHAVRITIGINNTVWEHILIYDKDNKRIRTIKYASGHYHS